MYHSLLEGIGKQRVRCSEGGFGGGGKREPMTRRLGGLYMQNVVLANKQSLIWLQIIGRAPVLTSG